MRVILTISSALVTVAVLSACEPTVDHTSTAPIAEEKIQQSPPSYYGTTEAFAEKSIYFVVTDRFVNGDASNDQREQGGEWKTFDRPVPNAPKGESANIGYLGGDFKGVLDNADYIRDMGFSSVWITPIVDNPDAAFSGGKPVSFNSTWTDQGKTGYHGYWGVNFYRLDEHLPSEGLDFSAFTRGMRSKNLNVVLDIVGNHGAPAFTMPKAQAEFGKLFGKNGELLADHQNLMPDKLDPQNNPLHAFFNTKQEIAELADFNGDNPAVLDYLAGAYEQWIDQGADAFRIDTIGWQPHSFWKAFADRIREKKPQFFMFGEDFRWTADEIAPHTWPENGGISVLDFPLKKALAEIFENDKTDFNVLSAALYLEHGPYANPYDLVTFYDNHDMARMNASDHGFIDANNWLFTARGIPAIYYGSEVGFMRGKAEHAGNRNYFGQQQVDSAPKHVIYQNLKRIANVRAKSIALQRGLQLNIELKGDRAAFYRVYQHEGIEQIALVLLNKGDAPTEFAIKEFVEQGSWRSALDDAIIEVNGQGEIVSQVPAHGVQVLLLDKAVSRADLHQKLAELMANKAKPRKALN